MHRCEVGFLSTGCCRHPEAATLRGGSLKPIDFPNLVGVLRHPQEGIILFDTGYDPAFLTATDPFPERFYRWAVPPDIAPERSARAQLERRGIAAGDVRWVVLSHFHGDHVSGLNAFPDATIVCSREGLRSARRSGRLSNLLGGVLPALLPSDLDARVVFFEDRPQRPLPKTLAPFDGGADVLGDGSLLALPLPGHCPGHWGLVARDDHDAVHVLVGDAAWSSRAIRENRPPPRVTTQFLGRTAAYRDTLNRLHTLAQAAPPDLVITPAHCAERAADLSGPAA